MLSNELLSELHGQVSLNAVHRFLTHNPEWLGQTIGAGLGPDSEEGAGAGAVHNIVPWGYSVYRSVAGSMACWYKAANTRQAGRPPAMTWSPTVAESTSTTPCPTPSTGRPRSGDELSFSSFKRHIFIVLCSEKVHPGCTRGCCPHAAGTKGRNEWGEGITLNPREERNRNVKYLRWWTRTRRRGRCWTRSGSCACGPLLSRRRSQKRLPRVFFGSCRECWSKPRLILIQSWIYIKWKLWPHIMTVCSTIELCEYIVYCPMNKSNLKINNTSVKNFIYIL